MSSIDNQRRRQRAANRDRSLIFRIAGPSIGVV